MGGVESQANNGTMTPRVFVYPPTSPPHSSVGGLLGGLAREALDRAGEKS